MRSLILCDTRSVPDTPEAAAGRRQTADRVLAEGAKVVADAMLPKLSARARRRTDRWWPKRCAR